MGIKNLRKLIPDGAIIKGTLADLANKKVAIDISTYVYQFTYWDNPNYLISFMNQLRLFDEYKIMPIYVFDGAPPEEKNDEIQKRNDAIELKAEQIKKKKETLDKMDPESDEAIKLKKEIHNESKKKTHVTDEKFNNVMLLFDLLNIKYYIAEGEAEHLCVQLSIAGVVDYIFSEDTDVLALGGNYLVMGLKNKKTAPLEIWSLQETLNKLELTMAQFIDLCILLECDYLKEKVPGVGPITALNLIKKYVSIEKIQEEDPKYVITDAYLNKVTKVRPMFSLPKLTLKNINPTLNINRTDELVDFLMDNSKTTKDKIEDLFRPAVVKKKRMVRKV